MYQELVGQYNNLSQNEKSVLFLYKTKIGLLLNDLNNNPSFENAYEKIKRIFSTYSELPSKLQLFSLIRLDSIESFKESLYQTKELLDVISTKMITTESINVYRAVSSDGDIEGISKDNIISTSLSFGDTLKYALSGDNISVFEIEIKSGSRLAYIPKFDHIRVKYKDIFKDITSDEEEIILNKDIYDFDTVQQFDNEGFKYVKVKAYDKKITRK